jgi:predicted DNA-binding transcriptional regulator YafY
MQGERARTGVCLDDIEARFGVRRSTAERMLRAVKDLFGQYEPVRVEGQRRFWALPQGALNLLMANPGELAGLELAAQAMDAENRKDVAEALQGIHRKLLAAFPHRRLSRIDTDFEALTEAEGLAMRPGPRPNIDPAIVKCLREAILAVSAVRVTYTYRGTGRTGWDILRPLGFLWGSRHYLVAQSERGGDWVTRNYVLSQFHRVEILDQTFSRDPDFSLNAYAQRSFGVFQEPPFEVMWRFSPEAAQDAREFLFHPAQTSEEQPDGSLIVRFRAGGAQEMAWHLLTWGDSVEVLEPQDFWDRVKR